MSLGVSMIRKIALFFSLICCLSASAYVITPLSVDSSTVALWNFDTISDSVYPDLVTNPMNGNAFNTIEDVIPSLPTSFGKAVKFPTGDSMVEVGVIQGSKIDFTGKNEFTVEAVISLLSPAPNTHVIYSSENIRLIIENNRLAGFVRQIGGLYGVIADDPLEVGTPYRVALTYKNKLLGISVNGINQGVVVLNDPIQAPNLAGMRATIGGDLFKKYFPGLIDDVRVSNINLFDIEKPIVRMVAPASYYINDLHPEFDFSLSDAGGSGVDSSSVKVYLNDVLQNNLTISSSRIKGYLDTLLIKGVLNNIKVQVADHAGNFEEKVFNISVSAISGKAEYETDGDTLGLWHMNDFSPSELVDSSGGNNHLGLNTDEVVEATIIPGVFGNAKFFDGRQRFQGNNIHIPGTEFTIEAWVQPTVEYAGDEYIFMTSEIRMGRFANGKARLFMNTTRGTKIYESTLPVLPARELHHLAFKWNGALPSDNLKMLVDGVEVQSFNACYRCSFKDAPGSAVIGSAFSGMIDEVRFSKVSRNNFNIPDNANRAINFEYPANKGSVNDSRPEVRISLTSSVGVRLETVSAVLNGVSQTPDASLLFSTTSIQGKFNDDFKLGLNTLDVSFLDLDGNQFKKSIYFIYAKPGLAQEYRPDSKTIALWHFNESYGNTAYNSVQTSKANLNIPMDSKINGVFGYARENVGTLPSGSISFTGRSFTIEGFYKNKTLVDPQNNRMLFQYNASDLVIYAWLSPSGRIYTQFSTPDQVIEESIETLVQDDGGYHHYAMVLDQSRKYGQLMIFIDGVLRQIKNVRMTCNLDQPGNLTVNSHSAFDVDEWRVSDTARYSFNYLKPVSWCNPFFS